MASMVCALQGVSAAPMCNHYLRRHLSAFLLCCTPWPSFGEMLSNSESITWFQPRANNVQRRTINTS
ncbi:hypothetical protein COCC4DRAFT_198581 [Bipolaris maydis ATCC 48331]|uniref:Uncharacterized protein n=2 Tax=Cochliobolus heterostrophus TaxID=5016 RepID=M2UGH5_COCH5|nr:uncharacterized protein COCC4DRAFT_198581 [Bipolaris maydis ATCC 48331]EMD87052.1 hypothetical protein COCHEDRAFT_1197907 [Bipolaris maydis C5]ENI03954.1 hypothetical protein COCC4DRAFT_198581 [Bipolaris maydis ATCC 48331]